MVSTQNQEYFIPSVIGLSILESLNGSIGKNGLVAILNQANLSSLIGDSHESNFSQNFDFSKISTIFMAVEEIYGSRGGKGLVFRAGRDVFNNYLKTYGVYNIVGKTEFSELPELVKIKFGLNIFAKVFNFVSDQITNAKEINNTHYLTIHRCPYCWDRFNEDEPICSFASGLIKESLKWISGGIEYKVYESQCIASGDEVCEFRII